MCGLWLALQLPDHGVRGTCAHERDVGGVEDVELTGKARDNERGAEALHLQRVELLRLAHKALVQQWVPVKPRLMDTAGMSCSGGLHSGWVLRAVSETQMVLVSPPTW